MPEDPRSRLPRVLIRVEAVSLNPVDLRTAAVGHPDWTYPHILGLDVSGTVEDIDHDDHLPGDLSWLVPEVGSRVVVHHDLRRQGGFADRLVARCDVVAPVPPTMDPIAAASLPTAGLTALDAVERRLRQISGQKVLIHGASGGVGAFAIQLADLFGATVIATARPEYASAAHALGAIHVLDYRDPDLPARVRALAPDGVDAIIDPVSAASATAGLGLLAHAGHLVAIAGRPDLATIPEFGLAPTISEVALGAAYTHGGVAGRRWLRWGLLRLITLIGEGLLHPPEIEVIGFRDIPEGLARLAAGEVDGKLVANLRWE